MPFKFLTVLPRDAVLTSSGALLCSAAPASRSPYVTYVSGTVAKCLLPRLGLKFVFAKKHSSALLSLHRHLQCSLRETGGKHGIFCNGIPPPHDPIMFK